MIKNIIFNIFTCVCAGTYYTLAAFCTGLCLYEHSSVHPVMYATVATVSILIFELVFLWKRSGIIATDIIRYKNRYNIILRHLINMPYEVQESMLSDYLKGKDNLEVYKTASDKVLKKPFITVTPDGRATFTVLEDFKSEKQIIPYLTI